MPQEVITKILSYLDTDQILNWYPRLSKAAFQLVHSNTFHMALNNERLLSTSKNIDTFLLDQNKYMSLRLSRELLHLYQNASATEILPI